MMRRLWIAVLLILLAGTMFMATAGGAGTQAPSPAALREAFAKGNFKDAFDGLSPTLLAPGEPDHLVDDFELCVTALRNLGRTDEVDAFREKVIAVHLQDWNLLWSAARTYRDVDHYGFMVAGNYQRGNPHGGTPGKWVSSFDRDRARALQLMQMGMTVMGVDRNSTPQTGAFYLDFSGMLLQGEQGPDAWRLQSLTDLHALPDYDENQPYYRGWGWQYGGKGAPVDEKGDPIFHTIPKDWASAATDGQRWRWALSQAAASGTGLAREVQWNFANFLHEQFGVQTMAMYGNVFRDQEQQEGKTPATGPFAVYTLKEDETIAKLATGVKRLKLPPEFNDIQILEALAAGPNDGDGGFTSQAMALLARTFQDRQQYDTAADWWRKAIAEFGPGSDSWRDKELKQVVGNWGAFENVLVQPAGGQGAKVDFRFRNGSKVSFSARAVDFQQLLVDAKAYIESKPSQINSDNLDINNIGWRLVERDQKKYIGKEVAAWDLPLQPRDKHFDKRMTVETPLKSAGAYLLTGTMENGNVSRILVWVSDTVIVRKQLNDAVYTYVADAATGKPIANASIDYFGYRQQWVNDKTYRIDIQSFSAAADGEGQSIIPAKSDYSDKAPAPVNPAAPEMLPGYNWLTTASTKNADGTPRFAFLGFNNIWYSHNNNPYESQYEQTKAFIVTDRPVYRPGDKVQWKMWLGNNKYDQDAARGASPFAQQAASLQMISPKGDVLKTTNSTLDEWGGMSGEFIMEKEATLGSYVLSVPQGWGAVSFRVEEYKKPEFEVKIDAPATPIMLGDQVTATISAKYYFGGAVKQAKVKYKVTRTANTAQWYPAGRWDWFYEPGYWWFGCDYLWYPGWERWGCSRPYHVWWPGAWSAEQPEIVSENEVPIGADGTVKVMIDTSVAKLSHGDQDHKYSISAEVTDASRRTIVGTGEVLVAREPFKVYAWVERGYYAVGDTVEAHFSAQTLDRKPVGGTGVLKLLKISYDADAKPTETEVQRWALDPKEDGTASVQIHGQTGGQYRLSYTVTDAKRSGRSIEGGYVFVIRGDGFNGKEFRFNDIELVTDKKEYAAGEKVRLMVNANRTDATVLLFLRPSNGVYLPPKVIHLTGKSTVEEVDVVKKDMPNFFVEAVTIADARVYSDVREVIVPPEDRILNVAVSADAQEYKPGQKAKLTLKVTDKNGEPFTGSAVLALYDKSVEYISGGPNAEDIRKFFWQWRRQHYPRTESSVDIGSGELTKSGEAAMGYLGAFGTMATEFGLADDTVTKSVRRAVNRQMGGGGGGGARSSLFAAGLDKQEQDSAGPMAATDMPASSPGVGPAPEADVAVRSNFADTASWMPNLVTAQNGTATVDVTLPESLTTWKARVWTLGAGTRVGEGDTEIVTTKNLIVRLEAPRFFVQNDEVVISAVVNNHLPERKHVRVDLKISSDLFSAAKEFDYGSISSDSHLIWTTKTLDVDANGEGRVDWRMKVLHEGTAAIVVEASAGEESDAMQLKLPVYVHGMLKTDSFSGVVRKEASSATITIHVPEERQPEQSRLEIRYSPTLAGAMVDALPYLVNYPYGCTEQTLNRFVPTVITQKVLLDMHLDLKAIQAKRTNLNAQEIGDDAARAAQWKHWDENPVFDKAAVDAMVRDGVTRLSNMQVSDGGWGWFSGTGEGSYPHTTAVVVHGLQIARENGATVDANVLERGVQWLVNYQTTRIAWIKEKRKERTAEDMDAFVYMVLVDADHDSTEMRQYLFEDRQKLAVYSKAMLGLALSKVKDAEKLRTILENFRQYVVQDAENQTAYLKMPETGWWYWYDSDFEANAYYLKLLARTDPKGDVASGLAKYLINNRRNSTYWNSTRDTADCIEALADYLRASGEDAPNMTVHIAMDGKELKSVKITAEDLFTFDNKVLLLGTDVPAGSHTVEVSREGTGPVYFNAYATNFTLEKHIAAAGLEVKVNRKVYLLTEADKTVKSQGAHGQAVDQRVEKYLRTELQEGATVKSGALVEIELTVDSKNDYEYIVLEDMKAAGFEPVEVRSGYNGNELGAYAEFHDERVAFFVRWLSRGKHSVSYRMRAEVPGSFSALPTKISAMYAPELKGNSEEIRLGVED